MACLKVLLQIYEGLAQIRCELLDLHETARKAKIGLILVLSDRCLRRHKSLCAIFFASVKRHPWPCMSAEFPF